MLRSAALVLIRLYKILLSPLLGPRCRFLPTCSEYAHEAFSRFPFHKALWYSTRRICKCHPFHPGGHDPVPSS